jgi:cytochrome c biogenesis protein CcmG/thiol:disulfide interchange protein DsbE
MATELLAGVEPEPPDGGGSAPAGRRRRVIVVAVIAVVLVGVGAAVLARSGSSTARVRDEGAAPAFDLPKVGDPATRVTLAQFRGRPLVVNFWASWCVPCRKEMPALERVSERLAGRVAFVGINHQDGKTSAIEFQNKVGVRYPSGSDPAGKVGTRYGVVGLPTTFLVDGSGRIVARKLGEVTEDELVDLIDRAFAIRVDA